MPLSHLLLTSGRAIELVWLRLSSTYGDMLEGYPSEPVNDRIVDAVQRAAERDHPGVPVHLIAPHRQQPDQPPGGFGPVEILPAVACIGSFRSTPVEAGHDAVLYRSALIVAWFQPTPDVPSGDTADPALRAIDWSGLAADGEL